MTHTEITYQDLLTAYLNNDVDLDAGVELRINCGDSDIVINHDANIEYIADERIRTVSDLVATSVVLEDAYGNQTEQDIDLAKAQQLVAEFIKKLDGYELACDYQQSMIDDQEWAETCRDTDNWLKSQAA